MITYNYPENIYVISCYVQEEKVDTRYFADNKDALVEQAIEYLKFAYKKGKLNIASEKYEELETLLYSLYKDTYDRTFSFPKGVWIEVQTIDILSALKYPEITILDEYGNKKYTKPTIY